MENSTTQKVKNFIDNHSIGGELLFKDWESFLDLLYSEGGHITAILWWDHCLKTEQPSSVGSGGYSDPDSPEFMYAETQTYENGFKEKTLTEIKEYIDTVRNSGLSYDGGFVSHDLIPAFYLD
jgi:hypothetical protein